MNFETLKEKFISIVHYYSWEMNTPQTREEVMRDFKRMIEGVRDEGHFNYTLMKKFVDVSTPELIDQGGFEINVELVNNKIVTLEEYCEIMTDREKYTQLLWEGIKNFKFTM